MCIESIELSSTHSYTWLAHSCSGQWHHCWVPILLGLNTQAESWAINGNNMFSSCSHHASFPSKRIKGRVWSPACQAVINVLSTAAISCLFFAAIALPRAMKTDRKGWQQKLKSYRGRYVTSSNIKNFLSVSWVDPVPPVLRPAVPQALPSRWKRGTHCWSTGWTERILIYGGFKIMKHDSRSGWWLGHPSEKYESQLGWLFPIYGKIKNVPNHQPDDSR